MLCEDAPSQIPTMYICPVTNVLGRIPLIPCYMDGQIHPTIPYRFRKSDLGGAIADSRKDNGTGSRLYELNVWLWNYGRSLPRPISVEETDKSLQKRMSESRLKGAETKKRRREGRVEPSCIKVSMWNIGIWCHIWHHIIPCYDVIVHGIWRHRHVVMTKMDMTSHMTKWVHDMWHHIPCAMMS